MRKISDALLPLIGSDFDQGVSSKSVPTFELPGHHAGNLEALLERVLDSMFVDSETEQSQLTWLASKSHP